MVDLSIKLAGIDLKNPLVLASGTAGYGEELASVCDFSELGAITLKSITVMPRQGNRSPRIWETTGGMLNSIGLENKGIDVFLSDLLPRISELGVPLIVSIAGETTGEYALLAKRISSAPGSIAAVEVNVSCPNVEKGGLMFGAEPQASGAVTSAVVENTGLPVFTKLSAAVFDVVRIAEAAAAAGASGLSLINTLPGMAINPVTGQPRLGAVSGGLSGPAVKPVAVKAVWDCYKATGLQIIGGGGVCSAADVVEFIRAGAVAVSIGTATFQDPCRFMQIARELPDVLNRAGAEKPADLVGSVIV
ncbi:MAG: dihydroorotate dehydrogenase [Actinobacteria bacterium]|nr:dihydroorotate dehydrogenase [Actinomycetota bacterium]